MSIKVDLLKRITEYLSKTKKFEQYFRHTKFLPSSNGTCKAEFTITEDHVNREGHFHQGLTATLVDITSSYALMAQGSGFSNVSTNIHVSHLQPAFPGEVLSIDAKVCRVTPPLAYAEVVLTNKNTEEIVACGQHTIFIKPSIDYKY